MQIIGYLTLENVLLFHMKTIKGIEKQELIFHKNSARSVQSWKISYRVQHLLFVHVKRLWKKTVRLSGIAFYRVLCTAFCIRRWRYTALGVSLEKIGWGCAARFLKPLSYFRLKSAIFPALSMTWPKISFRIFRPASDLPYNDSFSVQTDVKRIVKQFCWWSYR